MKTLEQYFQQVTADREPKNLYAPIDYILSQGGKRIRPKLVFLSVELFGGELEQAIYPAAAFEMLHNFTLIHDDIMDDAPIRRGKETVYKKWSSNIAILSGDALATMALQQLLLTPCESAKILKMSALFAQTSLEVCEGQQYDLNFETSDQVTIQDYIEMIRLKTAVMLAGCLKVGAILAGADEESQESIYRFGINLGIAFQLKDDLLDVYSDNTVFGKVNGGDIKVNKKTYLYLNALEQANPEQKKELLHYFSSIDFNFDEKFAAVKKIYADLQIKEQTEKSVEQYIQQALLDLEKISAEKTKKEELKQMALEFANRIK
ncbi:MAG: polyprenyl synthetase family protein [Bacteroidales bacterium]